jgi:polar amino acid transport system substrate-binding protein
MWIAKWIFDFKRAPQLSCGRFLCLTKRPSYSREEIMMIKTFLASLTYALCGIFSHATAVELPTSGRDSAPFFILKDGKASGVCPDIYDALERVNPEIRIRGAEKLLSLSLNEHALESGSSAINCGLGKSPHREPFVRYVELVATTTMQVAVRRDDAIQTIRDLDELAQLSKKDPVIVRRATVFADRLKERGVVIDDSSADNAANLNKLLAGRGRFYYNIDYLLAAQMRESAMAGKVRVLPTAMEKQSVYLVVSSKVDPSVDAMISEAYATLRKRGDIDAIFKRYGLSPVR